MKPNVVCICIFGINIDAGITGVQEDRQNEKKAIGEALFKANMAIRINGWVCFEAVVLRGVDTWLS